MLQINNIRPNCNPKYYFYNRRNVDKITLGKYILSSAESAKRKQFKYFENKANSGSLHTLN